MVCTIEVEGYGRWNSSTTLLSVLAVTKKRVEPGRIWSLTTRQRIKQTKIKEKQRHSPTILATIFSFGFSTSLPSPSLLASYPSRHDTIHLKTKQYVIINLAGLTSGLTLPHVLFVDT